MSSLRAIVIYQNYVGITAILSKLLLFLTYICNEGLYMMISLKILLRISCEFL